MINRFRQLLKATIKLYINLEIPSKNKQKQNKKEKEFVNSNEQWLKLIPAAFDK